MNYAVNIVREYIKKNLLGSLMIEYNVFTKFATKDYIDYVVESSKNGGIAHPIVFVLDLDIETGTFERGLLEVMKEDDLYHREKQVIARLMGLDYPKITVSTITMAVVDTERTLARNNITGELREVINTNEERLLASHRENIMGDKKSSLIQLEYNFSVGEKGLEQGNVKYKDVIDSEGGDPNNNQFRSILSDFYEKLSSVERVNNEIQKDKLMELLSRFDVLL